MPTVSELMSQNISNAITNSQTWGGILYNVKSYGAKGDGSTDDTAAIAATINAVKTAGGGVVFLPKGIYLISASLDISGVNYLTIEGVGIDASIIRINSATANVFTSTTASRWRTFKNFSIDSAVTRTAGAHFNLAGAEYRAVFEKIKLKDWFDGIVLKAYEQCWMTKVSLTEPDGAGTALQVGIAATSAQGANLNITDCFFRGTDGTDGVGGTAIGSIGIKILDADAVFMENTDIGGFVTNDLLISPDTRAANHHFTQCFFDATKNGACVSMGGAGVKQETTFTGCWFASAGQETGGSTTAPGIEILNVGSYRKIQFNGGRVFNCKGIGVKYQAPGGAQFNGMFIQNNGLGAVAGSNYGMLIDSPLNALSAQVHDCMFGDNNGDDIYVTANARLYTVQDCFIPGAFTNLGTSKRISGNTTDPLKNTLASADVITLPGMCGEFFIITGTTNITGITASWVGHRITLKFDGALTVVDASKNLQLAGNFVTAANSTITLVCDGATWFEVGRSAN